MQRAFAVVVGLVLAACGTPASPDGRSMRGPTSGVSDRDGTRTTRLVDLVAAEICAEAPVVTKLLETPYTLVSGGSASGRLILARDAAGAMALIDTSTGATHPVGDASWVLEAAGETAAVLGRGADLVEVDAATGATRMLVERYLQARWTSEYVVALGEGGRIVAYDPRTRASRQLVGPSQSSRLATDGGNRILVSDGTRWSVVELPAGSIQPVPVPFPSEPSFLLDGRAFIFVDPEGDAVLWRPDEQEAVPFAKVPPYLQERNQGRFFLDLDAAGRRALLRDSHSGRVWLWEVTTSTFELLGERIRGTFSPEGTMVLLLRDEGDGCAFLLHDVATASTRVLAVQPVESWQSCRGQFSADGTRVVGNVWKMVSYPRWRSEFFIWNATTGELLQTDAVERSDAVSVDPNARRDLIVFDQRAFYRLTDGERVFELAQVVSDPRTLTARWMGDAYVRASLDGDVEAFLPATGERMFFGRNGSVFPCHGEVAGAAVLARNLKTSPELFSWRPGDDTGRRFASGELRIDHCGAQGVLLRENVPYPRYWSGGNASGSFAANGQTTGDLVFADVVRGCRSPLLKQAGTPTWLSEGNFVVAAAGALWRVTLPER